jgi:hypothetical protein
LNTLLLFEQAQYIGWRKVITVIMTDKNRIDTIKRRLP